MKGDRIDRAKKRRVEDRETSEASDSETTATRRARRLLRGLTRKRRSTKDKARRRFRKIKAWLVDPTRGEVPWEKLYEYFRPLTVEEDSGYEGSKVQFDFLMGEIAQLCEQEGLVDRARDFIVFQRLICRICLTFPRRWSRIYRAVRFWLKQVERGRGSFRKVPKEVEKFLDAGDASEDEESQAEFASEDDENQAESASGEESHGEVYGGSADEGGGSVGSDRGEDMVSRSWDGSDGSHSDSGGH